ncbi:Gfo/Idh/MocA family protein [Flavivirga eckloniae]|uniref:Dehydrogenase n=1 Tax=Flavivirga eckloniae TaxID=1803846 RepID=A0A2K9PUH6_9FLAO|nr:Gfo/Idh/MocA family oxidoreductase [Flavivirga eckloniae]AUP80699.1 dehydrogenase [Flavivirga eckloniae]
MKRREFIKSAAITGTGMLAAPNVLGASVGIGNQDRLKIALIGCGGRGTSAALDALRCGVPSELVAMADLFSDVIEKQYKALSDRVDDKTQLKVTEKTKFIGLQGFKEAIALCDIAFITTPAAFKPVIFEEAIKQGKHVFMEKPVCVDAYGFKKILETAALAKKNKRYVAAGLQRRYSQGYQKIVELIHDGTIGDVFSAECYWFGGPIGDLSRPRKDSWTEMEFQNRHWRSFSWVSGGNIIEYHVHNLDVINWALKQDNPLSVTAHGGKTPEKLYSGSLGGFDSVSSNFKYENGISVHSYSRNLPNCSSKNGEWFYGTKGRVVITGNDAKAYNNKGKLIFDIKEEYEGKFHGVHSAVQKTLLEAIYHKKKYINEAFYAANSCMTGVFGRMSAWSGKTLNWEDAIASEIKLFDYTSETDFNSTPPIVPLANGDYPVPVPGKTKVI